MATKSISVEKPDKKNRAGMTDLEGLAQALLRSAGLGIYIVQEGKFQYVNPLFQDLTGYTEEELLGTSSLNLVHAEDRETVRREAVENLKGQATYPYEYRLIKKNGDLMWVLENIVSAGYKGRPAAIGSFMDITERKQVEEMLRKSREEYRRLYEGINEAVVLYKLPDLKISHWNKRYEDLHKLLYTKDIESTTISDIASVIEADDWDRMMEGITKTLAGEPVPEADIYELRMKDVKGKRRVLEVRPSSYKEKGHVVGIQVVMADITERKEAEETLRESEERYSQLYENINEAVALYRFPDLKVNHWNKCYEDMHKLFHTKDIESVTITDVASVIEADDWDRMMEGMTKTLAGEPMPEADVVEIKMRDLEGKMRVFEVRSTLYKEKDQVVGVQVAMVEITERKEAEGALQASEEKWRSLAQNAPNIIMIVNRDGKLEFINRTIPGIVMEEAIGRSIYDYSEPQYHTVLKETIEQVFQTGSAGGYEVKGAGLDGHIAWYETQAGPIKQDGRVVAVTLISTDITERKEAERERESLLQDIKKINRKLEESNKELQDFAYIASHDLREPLRKISSFGALLQDSLKGKLVEDEQENFEFMIDGSQRMQEMIDDLLTYSRLTTRAKPPQVVDLNEVIEDLKKLELATLLDETQGTIHVSGPLLPVKADLSQMRQLFQNLIGNGLKFHKKGIPPEITIRARQVDNNMIRVEVEDNGIGISEEYYEQVFVMFRRLHSRAQYEGTGIGLAACKKIVERHGGNIGVKSTSGEGSTFWFTLPKGSYSGDN